MIGSRLVLGVARPAFVCLLAMGLLGPAATVGAGTVAPWPTFQHDVQHTGRSTVNGPLGFGVEWTFPTVGEPGSPAVAPNGTIYLPAGTLNADEDGFLYAIDESGTQQWRYELPGTPSSTAPAIGPDGTIYVHANGSGNIASINNLSAVNPNGTEKWTFEFGGGAASPSNSDHSSPAIGADGGVWVGSSDTFLYKLDPDDGTVMCADSPTASGISSSPAIAPDGTVYVVDATTTLFAYEPDCDPKWAFQLSDEGIAGANPQSPMVAANGVIWVGSLDDNLYAVNSNGTLRCRFVIGSTITSTPALGSDGTVYVGSNGLYAVNPNCTQRWRFEDPLFSSASPVIGADGTIYWRESFTAYAVNPNGTQRWATGFGVVGPGTGGNDPSGAIAEEGVLYFADGGFSDFPTRLRAIADTTPPETTITGGPSGPTNDPTPTFTFSSSEAGSTFECRVDAAAFAPCTSPHTTAPLSNSAHTFEVRATDGAGNTDGTPAIRSFTVDTAAPETTIDSGPSGPTNDPTPTFTFSSSEAGSTFECRVDAAAFAPCTSPHTTAPLSSGAHTFEVRARDAAGNTDASASSRAFTVDAQPPDTTIVSGPTGPTNDSTPTFSFTSNEAGSTFQCRVDAGAFVPCTSPVTTPPLADGAHTASVRAIDPAGNVDGSPATRSLTVDTDDPETTITGGPSGRTRDRSPTFRFVSDEAGSTFECKLDRRLWRACTSPKEYGQVALGRHTFRVRATDEVGNRDDTPAVRTFRVVA